MLTHDTVLEDKDLEEYISMCEAQADDPDEPVQRPERYRALLAKYAVAGAAIGYQHGGPTIISVDADFMRGGRA